MVSLIPVKKIKLVQGSFPDAAAAALLLPAAACLQFVASKTFVRFIKLSQPTG
jgi:hypothetical protein